MLLYVKYVIILKESEKNILKRQKYNPMYKNYNFIQPNIEYQDFKYSLFSAVIGVLRFYVYDANLWRLGGICNFHSSELNKLYI